MLESNFWQLKEHKIIILILSFTAVAYGATKNSNPIKKVDPKSQLLQKVYGNFFSRLRSLNSLIKPERTENHVVSSMSSNEKH